MIIFSSEIIIAMRLFMGLTHSTSPGIVYVFNKYQLGLYYVPGTIAGIWTILMKESRLQLLFEGDKKGDRQ